MNDTSKSVELCDEIKILPSLLNETNRAEVLNTTVVLLY